MTLLHSTRILGATLALLGLGTLGAACASSNDAVREAELAENCSIDSDCSTPLVCAFQTCHIQCETTADCRAENLGLCVESDKPYKVCQNPQEESCTRNSDCAGTEVCATDGKCRDACVSSKDCISGQGCTSGVCADPTDLVDGGLVQIDGGAEGARCLHAADCPATLVCLQGTCTVECVADKDCPSAEHCEATRCIGAAVDASTGASSDAGSDAAASDGGVCPSGQMICGGGCVDTTSSVLFCHAAGKCGVACLPGETCSDGQCLCPSPLSLCDHAICIDTLTDPNNCNGCGITCSSPNQTELCVAGACTGGACLPGFADCDGNPTDGCETNVQTDSFNCGACNAFCLTKCEAGQCPVTTIEQAGATSRINSLSVDATTVYWSDPGQPPNIGIGRGGGTPPQGMINSAPLAGGATTSLAATQTDPSSIEIDATNVYWLELTSGAGPLITVPKAGGTPTEIETDFDVQAFTIFGTNVYITGDGMIESFPVSGGTSLVLASGIGHSVALAVDASYVYWTDETSGTVGKAKVDGTGSTILATGQISPTNLVIDASNIYWLTLGDANTGDGTVMQLPLGGGTPPLLLAGGGMAFGGLAVDATDVYWTDQKGTDADGNRGPISKVPIGGGIITVLFDDESQPSALAVDATSVYWVGADGVFRIPK